MSRYCAWRFDVVGSGEVEFDPDSESCYDSLHDAADATGEELSLMPMPDQRNVFVGVTPDEMFLAILGQGGFSHFWLFWPEGWTVPTDWHFDMIVKHSLADLESDDLEA